MDETATPSLDSSGNGNSGTWNGNTTSAAGKFGNGVTFDGTTDYINMGTPASLSDLPLSDFSTSMWIKPNSPVDYDRLIDKRGTSGGWTFYSRSSGNIGLLVSQSSAAQAESGSNGVTNASWNFVTAVYTQSTGSIKLYINASETSYSLNTTGSGSYTSDSSKNIAVGARNDGILLDYPGSMDDVRVYNRALSPKEVRDLYNWAPGPVVHLKMDEGSGTSAQDSSGNSRTGTLNGNPIWAPGKYGKGIKLDGTGDYVQVSDF